MNSTPLAINTAGDERRLSQNTTRIHALSSKCSSLIDVLRYAYYNKLMDEYAIVNLLAIETAAPKLRIARSAGAVHVTLIALVIGCISLGNLLYANWLISRYFSQPALYGLIAICFVILYRRHYVCFRYTLTNEQLGVEQIGGSGEKTLAAVELIEIRSIGNHTGKRNFRRRHVRASLPPQKNATWISAMVDGKEIDLTISASEEFVMKLTEQWRIATALQNG